MINRDELRCNAGQMLLVGFQGHSVPDELRQRLQRGEAGGVIYFARNLAEPEQVCALSSEVIAACRPDDPPPFISVDQEGGRVQRLRQPPFTRIPPMAVLGATGDAELAARIGQAMGEELAAVGINLDFAPCADLRTNPANQVIGDRSLGDDPATVARLCGAFAAGLTIAGVIPCFKHFPGHGDTFADSHFELPLLEHDIELLRRREIAVFARLLRGPVPMIMTAHLRIPAIDTRHPMTLSAQCIDQLLRRTLHHGGVVISDDLEMAAIADHHDVGDIVRLGLRAGLDLFLFCHSAERQIQAWEALVRLGEQSTGDRERIAQSAGRIRFLKSSYLRHWEPPVDVRSHLGTTAHEELVHELERRGRGAAP
ncbi:MAG: beta-N-acetylhexosaminidase [Deltaproteobacteria bacterium]|nr:MAG: beta-N-acetylhexosaminidase [Deltaproteobacteria bacterium]